MDSSREIITVNRVPMLEKGNYGHWKMKMRAVIRGISEDAWTAIETGWSAPVAKGEDGKDVPKQKNLWTDAEKRMSMYNSKALYAIFNAVNENQFKRIQCCESAKEAWDKLERAYEGTSKVKTSRLDMLASRFENLKMDDSETIEEFSAKLSSIASEAQNMGKKYKDKKLVKKLLRSLPPKFESKKTAMGTALDTDAMDFDEAVGHLQAYELELNVSKQNNVRNTAFVSEERREIEELKEAMSMFSKKFSRRCGNRVTKLREQSRNDGVKCYECQGFGHFKSDCPTAKRKEMKCHECKGMGHIASECIPRSRKKDKPYCDASESESEEDEDRGEQTGYVAFTAQIIEDSESDSDESTTAEENETDWEDFVKETSADDVKKLYDSWVQLGKDKLKLLQDKMDLIDENEKLTKELKLEKEKSKEVSTELSETMKKVHMLNSGTKDLEKILSMGRVGKSNLGLGCNGYTTGGTTQFVKGTTSGSAEQMGCRTQSRSERTNSDVPAQTEIVGTKFSHTQSVKGTTSKSAEQEECGTQMTGVETTNKSVPAQTEVVGRHFRCFYCNKVGHYKRFCYQFQKRVRQLISEGMYSMNKNKRNQYWIPQKNLYEVVADRRGNNPNLWAQPCDELSIRHNEFLSGNKYRFRAHTHECQCCF